MLNTINAGYLFSKTFTIENSIPSNSLYCTVQQLTYVCQMNSGGNSRFDHSFVWSVLQLSTKNRSERNTRQKEKWMCITIQPLDGDIL